MAKEKSRGNREAKKPKSTAKPGKDAAASENRLPARPERTKGAGK